MSSKWEMKQCKGYFFNCPKKNIWIKSCHQEPPLQYSLWEWKSLSCAWLIVTPWTIEPTRLLCPWNSPGMHTGMSSHSLLQGIFPTQGLNPGVLQCRQILHHLSHQGSPDTLFTSVVKQFLKICNKVCWSLFMSKMWPNTRDYSSKGRMCTQFITTQRSCYKYSLKARKVLRK